MRLKLAVVLILCVSALSVSAQKAVVFGGYAFTRYNTPYGYSPLPATSMNGWNASVTGNFNRSFGLSVDIGGGYGSRELNNVVCITAPCPQPSADFRFHTVMFGPQARFSASKVVVFGRGLVGLAHTSGKNVTNRLNLASDTSFAFGLGGGLDYKLNRFVAIRAGQLDYIRTGLIDRNRNHVRYSTGLVLRF